MYPTRESNTQSVVAVQQGDVIRVSDRRFVSNLEKLATREAKVQSWEECGVHLGETPRLNPGFAAAFGCSFNPYWHASKLLGLSRVTSISFATNDSKKLESYKALWKMIASMAFFRFSPRISRGRFNRVSRCTLDTLATPASATEYKKRFE